MTARHIFIVNDQNLYCFQDNRQGLYLNAVFANTSEGQANFAQFLDDADKLSVLLVVDCLEEFRIERIPKLLGNNRKNLLARKSRQIMPETRTVYQSLGWVKEQKKEEEILFIGLPSETVFSWCLIAIKNSNRPLEALYSISQINLELQKLLVGETPEYSLIFTHNPDSGTRQSFFRQGKILLSRLTKGGLNPDQQFFNQIRDEVYATRQYLNNLKLIPREAILPVHTLTSGLSDPLILEALNNTELVTANLHSYTDLLEKLRLENLGPEISLYQIIAYLANRKKSFRNFATSDERKGLLLHTAGNLLTIGSLAVAAGCMVLSLANVYAAWDYESRIQVRAPELNAQKKALRQVRNRMQPTSASPEIMKETVEWVESLKKQHPKPETYLALVGKVLEEFQDVRLKKFQWQNQSLQQQEGAGGRRGSEQVNDDADSPKITIDGEILNFDGNYRRAVERVHNLTRALEQQPAVSRVTALKSPVNLNSWEQFTGALEEQLGTHSQTPVADFSLEISLREAQ